METEREPTSKFLVPAAIVVAGALIAGAIYAGGARPTADSRQQVAAAQVPTVTSEDHIRGNPNAELVIVEYSDTECPFCKVFHNTLNQILREYGTEVAWVYRQFPIPQLHSRAMKEAEATECVAEIGGNATFWSYLDKIFETTDSNDSLDPAELPRLASALGLDHESFTNCLSSDRYEDRVKDSIAEAIEIGARGTPYSVIMDKDGEVLSVVNGAEPIEEVRAKLDTLLK